MSGHFEAKKIAWRQTKDGLVLALAVHPDDMPKEMALSPLNTRYMIGFAEIGDDEKPKNGSCSSTVEPGDLSADDAGSTPAGSPTSQASEAGGSPKKHWNELARSQQAAILIRDPEFWEYFGSSPNWINCDGRLKLHFRIASKSELDKPENHARWDEFVALYHLHRDRLR